MHKRQLNNINLIPLSLASISLLAGGVLASSHVSADDPSVVDEINITVPISCTMSGTGMQSHNANINNGLYDHDIGSTVLHAFCNDNEGFAIYAAGYTGNEVGGTNSNKLVGTTASGDATIESGIATTAGNPDVSNWAMKLTMTQDSGDTSADNAFTIDSAPNVALPSQAESGATQAPFSQYHVVPNEYVKVAHKNSGTDMTETTGGVKLTTTYAAYISKTQPADTYSGQVIYTLVHPANHPAPIIPAFLDTGQNVNAKMKSLAAGETKTYNNSDSLIKSIQTADSLPADFEPTEANTISLSTSDKPAYIFFDNTNDAGIMYVYSGNATPVLNPDSSYMFYSLRSLSTAPAISDWDTSGVVNMYSMFYDAGYDAPTFSLDLSSWDTSSVTDMASMFRSVGFSATDWSIGDLSSWNTSSVTNMGAMFYAAGRNVSTFSLDLSDWDTSSVTNMSGMFLSTGLNVSTFSLDLSDWDTSSVTNMNAMFYDAGMSASTFSLDLSNWDTSRVTNMSGVVPNMGTMLSGAGPNASIWSVIIPQTNGNGIDNTTSRMYGNTVSVYATPSSGKAFTLAP